ncbi:MAG: polyprenyl synthetase family protein [Bacteroidales bacterium]|nr:polyprenyl synthetase family protein [Bacteroidales bacterium]
MYTYKELTDIVQHIFAEENFIGEPAELYEPIDYTLGLGGKRLRPVLLLAANDLFGGTVDNVRAEAVAIEMFHNFTLLHDDLMDQSPLRRGKPTVYKKWNPNTAILSGDAMTAMAWRYMLKNVHQRQAEILDVFNETCMMIYEGQQYDMNFETRNDVTIPEYMGMIRLKTAVLLAGALKIGALCANADDAAIEALYNFGIETGFAFQLRDDQLDAWGDTATFGKQTGTDIKDNKKTYLYLRALEKGDAKQTERLRTLFSSTPDDPSAKIAEVLDIYAQLNIADDVEKVIAEHEAAALRHLETAEKFTGEALTLRQVAQKLAGRKV